MKPELRVALLGQGFMGRAHSNAYAQVGHFYDLPYRVRRTLLCGRDAASLASMADRWGWELPGESGRSGKWPKDENQVSCMQGGKGLRKASAGLLRVFGLHPKPESPAS